MLDSEDHPISKKIKEYYFRKAFGDDYNVVECERMLAMVSAQYWIENVMYYNSKEAIAHKDIKYLWVKKRLEAVDRVGEWLRPYLMEDDVNEIVDCLQRGSPQKQEKDIVQNREPELPTSGFSSPDEFLEVDKRTEGDINKQTGGEMINGGMVYVWKKI